MFSTLVYHTFAMATKTANLHVHHAKELYSILLHASATMSILSYKSIIKNGSYTEEQYGDAALR